MMFPKPKIKSLHATNTLNACKRAARYKIHLWKCELNIAGCNKLARKVFDIRRLSKTMAVFLNYIRETNFYARKN